MPAMRSGELVRAIEDAFAESTASALFVSPSQKHPKQFYVTTAESSFSVWVYIWTLTHGGGAARPKDEYRIQLTSVEPPLQMNPDGPTLLLGFEPDTKCFAGFDLRKHKRFSTRSPSIQINITALREAARDGFSFTRKGNDEIAIAFRPDNMLAYCLNSDLFHEGGTDLAVLALLSKVSRFESLTERDLKKVTANRRRIVVQVSRLARASNFRQKVVVAYDRRCCVTGLQLRLIEAAHILPVGAKRSTDDVCNGLCLSPTYHLAYDRGLIYLTEDRKMLINPKKKEELIRLGLGGGIGGFESHLGREVCLPADKKQWPNIELIKSANKFRKAAGLL